MVRELQPWHSNTKKRLVKSPKIYIKDSGIFHALATIHAEKQLMEHNKLGASWEGFALECVSHSIKQKDNELYFWATHNGAELDLFWQHNGKNWGIEFKYQDALQITKSMRVAVEDLSLAHLWVIYPGTQAYTLDKKITVLPLTR